ncbi:MAG TPA: MarR family transcriptional regulator [Gammaproteobacteria bacterium]|nr:MarR family transcriptional regulator [Gammaproteobacteria bacterium]
MSKLFDPDRSLGVLISDVAKLLRRSFDRRLQSLGLTQAQWRAIVNIARTEGMSQTALAECLEIQPITVGRLIDRMQNAGWVERRGHPLDRRAVQLYLTAKCQPILEEIHVRANDMMAECVTGVPAAAQKQLFDGLKRIKQNLATAEAKFTSEAQINGRTNDVGRSGPPRIQRTAR